MRTRSAQRDGMELVQRLRASCRHAGLDGLGGRDGPPAPGALRAAARRTTPCATATCSPSRKRIGMRSYYIVPLIARGRTLGALAALQAESGRSSATTTAR